MRDLPAIGLPGRGARGEEGGNEGGEKCRQGGAGHDAARGVFNPFRVRRCFLCHFKICLLHRPQVIFMTPARCDAIWKVEYFHLINRTCV